MSKSWMLAVGYLLVICCGELFAAPAFAPGVSLGIYQPPAVEISGVAASFTSPGVLWAQSDSGDAARFFALSTAGQRLGTFVFTSGDNEDYEDIAVGPGPVAGVQYIYVGDIGDNSENRQYITVYRVPEPVVYLRQAAAPPTVSIPTTTWKAIALAYPGIPFLSANNAETLMVDPRNGDVLVGTKEDDQCRIFRAAAADLDGGDTITMTEIANVGFDVASAGAISPLGTELIIRRETFAQLWTIGAGQSIQAAMLTTPVTIPTATEANGEAVTFDKSGSGYITLSEGANVNVWHFARTSDDGPTPQVSIISPEADWRYLDDGSDQGTSWRLGDFDDASWNTGPAQLGYGQGDEQTVLSFGDNASQKHITTYFRKEFDIAAGASFETLALRVVYEGGVAVYLNGTEILRKALAADAASTALATGTRGATKSAWLTVSVNSTLLVAGANTLAVETHLASASQVDTSFDLQLEGTAPFFDLSLTENEPDWGEIVASPAPNAGDALQYISGTLVDLTANPAEGYAMQHWLLFDPAHPDDPDFAAELADNSLTIAMNSDQHVEAVWQVSTGEGEGVAEGQGDGAVEGVVEGTVDGEGVIEGEGDNDGEGGVDGIVEGNTEGVVEGVEEGQLDGTAEGGNDGAIEGGTEGVSEGMNEGAMEGVIEGIVEGAADGAVDGEGQLEGEGELEGIDEGSIDGGNDGEGQIDGVVDGEGGNEGAEEGGADGQTEGSPDGEGGGEGEEEGIPDGEGAADGEGQDEGDGGAEGEGEAQIIEGVSDGEADGEGDSDGEDEGDEEGSSEGEGEADGEGNPEGDAEGDGEGESEGTSDDGINSVDQDGNHLVSLSELLRLIQFFNSGGLHCDALGEDGYAPGPGDQSCDGYDVDYNPRDWMITLSELLRAIQFFNSGGYHFCPQSEPPTEDGYCSGL